MAVARHVMEKRTIDDPVQRGATVPMSCGHCGKEYQIPAHAVQNAAVRREAYDPRITKPVPGVYVSPGGYPYCSEACFNLFTED